MNKSFMRVLCNKEMNVYENTYKTVSTRWKIICVDRFPELFPTFNYYNFTTI